MGGGQVFKQSHNCSFADIVSSVNHPVFDHTENRWKTFRFTALQQPD